MKRFWVFALGLSRPGEMGGNSKIALEVTRCRNGFVSYGCIKIALRPMPCSA